jgi:hypothetical protein
LTCLDSLGKKAWKPIAIPSHLPRVFAPPSEIPSSLARKHMETSVYRFVYLPRPFQAPCNRRCAPLHPPPRAPAVNSPGGDPVDSCPPRRSAWWSRPGRDSSGLEGNRSIPATSGVFRPPPACGHGGWLNSSTLGRAPLPASSLG